jgi:predicted HAD superfamily Cof-like phosphohydrolase
MRTTNREDVVQEFHDAFELAVDVEWTPEVVELRMRLIREEWDELFEAYMEYDFSQPQQRAHFLKELADLQYVVSGTAVALGLPLQQAFIRVHKSNMSKLDENGKPIYREDGKVLKSENYAPPTLIDLV